VLVDPKSRSNYTDAAKMFKQYIELKKHPINNNNKFSTRMAGKANKYQNYSKNLIFVTYLKTARKAHLIKWRLFIKNINMNLYKNNKI